MIFKSHFSLQNFTSRWKWRTLSAATKATKAELRRGCTIGAAWPTSESNLKVQRRKKARALENRQRRKRKWKDHHQDETISRRVVTMIMNTMKTKWCRKPSFFLALLELASPLLCMLAPPSIIFRFEWRNNCNFLSNICRLSKSSQVKNVAAQCCAKLFQKRHNQSDFKRKTRCRASLKRPRLKSRKQNRRPVVKTRLSISLPSICCSPKMKASGER